MWSHPFDSALGLVSALALRARANTIPSGWDQIYHVIFYMISIMRVLSFNSCFVFVSLSEYTS